MKNRILLANDGVSIDFRGVINFLVESSNHLVFEEFPEEIIIKDDEVSPSTYDKLGIEIPEDVLFVIIFTDTQYYNNYFYEEQNSVIIASFFAWEYLTTLHKNNGAAFFVMEVISEFLDSSFRHTLNGDGKPECIYDFLVDKTGIDSSMRSSFVCTECNKRIKRAIKDKNTQSIFEDFKNILNHIGSASKWDEDLIKYWESRKPDSSNSSSSRKCIFISYSHADSDWLMRVKVHLKPLEKKTAIDIWEDTRIKTGDNWKEEILVALERAHAAILLISADFLASDFITENELPPILEKAQNKGTKIFPLLLSPSCFDESPELSAFQAVNSPSKTLIEVQKGKQERFLLKLAKDIISYVSES